MKACEPCWKRLLAPAGCFLLVAILGAHGEHVLAGPAVFQEGRFVEDIDTLLAGGRCEEAAEVVLKKLRSDSVQESDWREAFRVFDACIFAGEDTGLMDAAVGLTESRGEHAGAWILLGKVYLGQAGAINRMTGFEGSFRRSLLSEAANAFRTALERDPASAEAGNHLAYVLFLLGNVSRAHREIGNVIAGHPDNAYAAYLLAEIEMRRGETAAALDAFRRAGELDPSLAEAREGEVRALVVLKRGHEASDVLLKLLRDNPDRDGLDNLARSIHEPGEKYLDAIALYGAMLEVAPERSDILYLLAAAEYRIERLEDSRRHAEEALRLDPEHGGARYCLGLIHEKSRRFDEAGECYLALLDGPEDYLDAAIMRLKVLAYIRASAGRFAEAVAIYDRLLPILPFDTAMAANRALALSQSGKREAADKAYVRILEIDPDDGQVLNDYALHLMGSGRADRALDLLEKAWTVHGNIDAGENLGAYHYYTRGDPERAAGYFVEVLEKEPMREKSLILLEAIGRRNATGDG